MFCAIFTSAISANKQYDKGVSLVSFNCSQFTCTNGIESHIDMYGSLHSIKKKKLGQKVNLLEKLHSIKFLILLKAKQYMANYYQLSDNMNMPKAIYSHLYVMRK